MRYWLIFSLMLAVLWFAPVMAQGETALPASDQSAAATVPDAVQPTTDAATPAAAVNPTTPIVSEELEGMEIEEPKEVPSGFGLWWKGVKEKVSIGLTFNPVKKAEKQLQFAEERMRLAELMAQKSKDQKVQARIYRVIGQAQEMMEKVEARRERLLQQKDEQGVRLLRNIATHQIRREAVMDKIEEKLPEGAVEKFDELREKAVAQERRLLNAINNENAPAEVREHLQAVKDRIETHAEEIKLFRERRVELMDEFKAGDDAVKEQAKEEMKELRQDRVEMLKDRREERVENRQEFKKEKLENKLENIKEGGAIKPSLENKPGAIIKLKA
ncbi:MAG: hypothetical protein HZC26_02040, partial [Candidatus Magasanikbacteria bacterium]|nr:hypothetical protein [Candidatus Magasanikbacteria bacterium]